MDEGALHEADADLFGTETMAELCARQGRAVEAVRIYRRLIAGPASDESRQRWTARVAELEALRRAQRAPAPISPRAAPVPHRLPVIVHEPVRSGQVIMAEKTDLIVLAPVNPGAELIADGHIHVYAALRGRAIAGASGQVEARIFCLRLEAELVAIHGVHLAYEELPPALIGRAAQIARRGTKCVATAL
jgi:septum site-determining protein MinC